MYDMQPQFVVFLIIIAVVILGIIFVWGVQLVAFLKERKRKKEYNTPEALDERKAQHLSNELLRDNEYKANGWGKRTHEPFRDRPYYEREHYGFETQVLVTVIGAFLIVCFTLPFIPFNSYYYQNIHVTGTVTKINGVMDTGGKYVNNDFAVQIDGKKTQYKLDDTRILDYKGRTVSLLCGPAWQYQGDPVLHCSILR